ncbi:MAG: hypothetical protein LAN59_03045 [Acidobacteriia bacterium]|nr:hypothetical protein [Terriglobia bacterium]
MGLVNKHGERWARNKENFQELRSAAGNPRGVYILCDGSMPLYVGRGRIASRIKSHTRGKSKGQYWDHFTWYEIQSEKHRKDIESLLLRLLPFYLRSLNKQRGHLPGSHKFKAKNPTPDIVKKPHLAPPRRKRRKSKSK